MWTCPNCKRSFKSINQWHSCLITGIDNHLANKPSVIVETYRKLETIITRFGKVEVCPVKTSIQFRSGSNFSSLRITAKYIQVEFQLPHEVDEFPIHEILRMSKNRVLHRLMVENPKQVDETVVGWLKESYELICKTQP